MPLKSPLSLPIVMSIVRGRCKNLFSSTTVPDVRHVGKVRSSGVFSCFFPYLFSCFFLILCLHSPISFLLCPVPQNKRVSHRAVGGFTMVLKMADLPQATRERGASYACPEPSESAATIEAWRAGSCFLSEMTRPETKKQWRDDASASRSPVSRLRIV